MHLRALGRAARRPAVTIPLVCALIAGCSDAAPTETGAAAGDPPASANEEPTGSVGEGGAVAGADDATSVAELGHVEATRALAALLPPDTRGVAAIDLGPLLAGGSSGSVETLLDGDGDPFLAELTAGLGSFVESIDGADGVRSALVARTLDPATGPLVLAAVDADRIEQIVAGPSIAPDGTYGSAERPGFVDRVGRHLALLPGGVLVAGERSVVESVVERADDTASSRTGELTPFLETIDGGTPLAFVYGLPALYHDVEPDRTLRGAVAMSGSFDVSGDAAVGELVVHTTNAAEFVEAYNVLDRHAAQAADPTATPLVAADPVVEDIPRVVVPLPPMPLDPDPDDLVPSRNVVKKLIVGMEAHDYAEDVFNPGNAAWFDFLVKSEADDPPSPGSVYLRWEFRDQAAVEAFERNELPAGFRLAPTRFLESDPPGGGYFLALNLYDGGGGMIVGGARAEWDVFVHGPDGADPNAGVRPRFMVVDVAAEEVSANSRDLLTPAEPVSHELVDGVVTSSVRRLGDAEPVFASSFPVPDPARDEVARFTREMAIGNDYIYWAHGVSDRVLYNATTFNHDAYFVDPAQISVVDNSRWAQYLKPEVSDAVYYVNTLEYVASPMANLVDSEHLDITPEWRDELLGFVNNGHQVGLMRKAVELLFRGEGDALVPFRVSNETPSTYYHFEITDPEGLADALDLPPGHRLAPMTLFDGGEPGQYLTLAITEVDDALEGTRAEWMVYTDDGDGRPNAMVIDLMTEDIAFDPQSVVNLPSVVEHQLEGGALTTRLASDSVVFEATLDREETRAEDLSLDWIEAGDIVCRPTGVCDQLYYDAETLDVPVAVADDIAVDAFVSPWSDFVAATPSVAFFRDNSQLYVRKRWENLAVPVPELPFTGLDGRTHTISGSGSLVGRTGDIADSDYAYTGDAVVDDGRVTFAIDQRVVNALGEGHIYTTGSFDLATGTGTQTVIDCQGPALLCSGIENGSTEFYTAQALDASDLDAISWAVDVAVDLGGTFGVADSSSTFLATRDG